MKNKNAHEYYAQGVQKEALFLPFFEKTAKQAVPNTFSHPDCTVGLGFAPSQSLSTAYDSESRAQTCVRHYRRSGIAPYPEGWYSVRQSIAHFSLLSVIIYWRSALTLARTLRGPSGVLANHLCTPLAQHHFAPCPAHSLDRQ